jgi:hypothetical protein
MLAMVSSQGVSAEDFTVMVPVNLSNLEESADGVKVNCNLSSTILAVNDNWGAWEFTLPIPANRSINTTLEAKINTAGNRNPARVTNYKCEFFLSQTGNSNYLPPKVGCQASDPDLYRCALDGTLIGSVQGMFP